MRLDERMRQAGASVRRYADTEVDPVAMLWRLRTRQRRRSRQTVAVAFAVLAGLVAAAVLVVRAPRQPEVLASRLGRVVATIALPQAPAPRVVGVADGLVWVDGGNAAAIGVDPQTNRVARTLPLPARSRLEAVEPGSLWLVNDAAGTVSQADPRTGRVRQNIPVGPPGEGWSWPRGAALGLQLAFDGDAVWVSRGHGHEVVVHVSRARAQVTNRVATAATKAIAAGDGTAMAIGWDEPHAVQLDPQTSKPTTIPVGGPPGGVAFGAGSFWVSAANYTLARIDPASRRVVATIPLDDLRLPGSVVVTGEAVWVFAGGLLQRIDPAANRVVHTLQVGPQEVEFGRLAAGAGAVWLSDARARTLLRINPQG